jgi:hypothetical protein
MSDGPGREPELLHQFTNHLSVIVGFCDMLLAEMAESDERHADIREISKAANAAMALLPELSRKIR